MEKDKDHIVILGGLEELFKYASNNQDLLEEIAGRFYDTIDSDFANYRLSAEKDKYFMYLESNKPLFTLSLDKSDISRLIIKYDADREPVAKRYIDQLAEELSIYRLSA